MLGSPGQAQAGGMDLQELVPKGSGTLPLLGARQAPGGGFGHSIPLCPRCWQGRVMGLQPRQHGLEPGRVASGRGFIYTNSSSWEKQTEPGVYPT